ncbi:MAG TPA: STAS domain-containing protein [Bacteroidota bacterium]|nr:STAS domain-containing protein [Bacteroidota bacterium]
MECTLGNIGTIQVAAPAGDLDVAVAPQLRELLKGIIEKGATKILVDMRLVTFIDSSCLGVLVNAHKLATANGGAIKFAETSEQVRKIFELTRVDKHLSFYPSIDEAVSGFSE